MNKQIIPGEDEIIFYDKSSGTETVAQEVIDFIMSFLGKLLQGLLDWLMPRLYWITVILCVIFIIYYAATKSKKCLRISGIILITYILLRGIEAVL